MTIKNVYVSTRDILDRPDVYSAIEVDPGIKGLKIDKFKLSDEAAKRIISIVEEDLQDTIEDRVKELANVRLEPFSKLLGTIEVTGEEVVDD
jgi:hypothetical protein